MVANLDGNTYAINQHLYSMGGVDHAERILEQMTEKEIMEYAKDWDIYIKDDKGSWVSGGFDELYDKINDNLEDFVEVIF